jgi:RNA polymerase sigma-70 factor (ECF subfamily)
MWTVNRELISAPTEYLLCRSKDLRYISGEVSRPALHRFTMPDHEPRTDDELIAGIVGGDREAFALLYRRYRTEIYRFAAHVSGSPAVADDVVQDVFVAVIEGASRYRLGQSGVLPWLLGIARNHVRRWRSQRPVLPLPGDETQDGRQLSVKSDPLVEISLQRNTTALRRALLELPVRYREAIVLCDLQELSYVDAANALGCAVGTVRSRLHRGRALLARRLSDSEGGLICRIPATRSFI